MTLFVLATVLATFQNIGQFFSESSVTLLQSDLSGFRSATVPLTTSITSNTWRRYKKPLALAAVKQPTNSNSSSNNNNTTIFSTNNPLSSPQLCQNR
jgi:hypothetical protein